MLVRRSAMPVRNRKLPGPLVGTLAVAMAFIVACLVAEPEVARAAGYILSFAAAAVAMANEGLQLLDRWGSRPHQALDQDRQDHAATGDCPDKPDSSGPPRDRTEGTPE